MTPTAESHASDAPQARANECYERAWLRLLHDSGNPATEPVSALRVEIANGADLTQTEVAPTNGMIRTGPCIDQLDAAFRRVAPLRHSCARERIAGPRAALLDMAGLFAALASIVSTRSTPGRQPFATDQMLHRHGWIATFIVTSTSIDLQHPSEAVLNLVFELVAQDHADPSSQTARRIFGASGSAATAISSAMYVTSQTSHAHDPEAILALLDAATSPRQFDDWKRQPRRASAPTPGFTPAGTQRSEMLTEALRTFALSIGSERIALAVSIEAWFHAQCGLTTMPHYWWAVVLDELGVPRNSISLALCWAQMASWTSEALRSRLDAA